MVYRFLTFSLDSDFAFPELEPAPRDRATLVLRETADRHRFEADDWFHSIGDDGGEPWLRVGRAGPASYVLRFQDRLFVAYSSSCLTWWRDSTVPDEWSRHILLDQALPLIAAHEGCVVLHAACALREERALLFAAPAGEGKSTLVATLLAQGWTCADDAAALRITRTGLTVRPSYGGLRLWPDTAAALGYPTAAAANLPSGKRRFSSPPLPAHDPRLSGIYVLTSAEPGSTPVVRDLPARDALMALVRNSYVLDAADRGRSAAHFRALSAAVSRVRVRSLSIPRRFDALHEVCRNIERDLYTTTG